MRQFEELMGSTIFVETSGVWKTNMPKEVQKGIIETRIAIRNNINIDPFSSLVFNKMKPILKNQRKFEVINC